MHRGQESEAAVIDASRDRGHLPPGDHIFTGEDLLTARKFEDGIARGTSPVDIHNLNGKGTVPRRDARDIPLRCLPRLGVDDLLTAGRCISGTREARSSYRVTLTAMATGQAAGVCAALAAASGRRPREVQVQAVPGELIGQGVRLGAKDTRAGPGMGSS